MSYLRMRKQPDGSTRYIAVIRIRVGKAIVHQEAKTFAHRSAAQTCHEQSLLKRLLDRIKHLRLGFRQVASEIA